MSTVRPRAFRPSTISHVCRRDWGSRPVVGSSRKSSSGSPTSAQAIAQHLELAAVRLAQALEHLHGGRLARAVGSEHAEALARVDLEVEARDRLHVAVTFYEAAAPQRRPGRW